MSEYYRTGPPAPVRRDVDGMAGFDQEAQLGRDAAVFALPLDEVSRQADVLGARDHVCSSARVTTSRTSLLRSGLAATR